tara:strand:+ start:975 stop:2087 length:1113 start_codon:yes stop_codon:yes gene_type:complete
MIVGVPKEIKPQEMRVALTPHGVLELTVAGHDVVVEKNAGAGSGFSDEDYETQGAEIAASLKEVYTRAEMIVKVKEPLTEEISLLSKGKIVFTYFHFAASETLTRQFAATEATGLAYETMQLDDGSLPLLIPMSEVAGRMSVQEGAKYLEQRMGGKGVLLGGVPGVEPATVVILGGGIVGTNAAKIAAGLGAIVYVLDTNVERLRYLDDTMPKNVITLFSSRHSIIDLLPNTDLLVGAVLIVGARAPKLVTRDMLNIMDKGSVIVDVSVDQGGCIETCKPTTHEDPIYVVDDIIHYCVANMPGAVPFTSTIALTNSTLPYVKSVADLGLKEAVAADPHLLSAVNTCAGKITHCGVAEAFGIEYHAPSDVI